MVVNILENKGADSIETSGCNIFRQMYPEIESALFNG